MQQLKHFAMSPRPLTIPVAAFAAFALILLNLTGLPGAVITGGGISSSGNVYGWPNLYLTTDLTDEQFEQMSQSLWHRHQYRVEPATIDFQSDAIQEFSSRLLWLNLGVCCATILFFAFMAEYWQRVFGYSRRIGSPVILLFAVSIGFLGWLTQTALGALWLVVSWPWLQAAAISISIVLVLVTVLTAISRCAARHRTNAPASGTPSP